jgi:thiamine-phosphate pyrophosphorylase
LYAITPDEPDTDALLRKVAQAIAGGARLVQYRNKAAASELRLAQARALMELCRPQGVPLIVNDHLDLALAVDADGLHLGADDGNVASARRALGQNRMLGASCYNRFELAVAARDAGADHVAFGAAFASPTKPGAVSAPHALYARARAELGLPVVAIGGITADNAAEVIGAGAQAVAVITDLFSAADITAAARRYQALFDPSVSTLVSSPAT